MLNFNAAWAAPVPLIDGKSQGLTYAVERIENIPQSAGAYVFARTHGKRVFPLYIGETKNLRKRLDQHLKGNVKLMNGILRATGKKRVFLYCTIKTASESKRASMLAVLQQALIEHALAEGHKLFNVQGTRISAHTISFTGNRASEQIAPRTMYVQP